MNKLDFFFCFQFFFSFLTTKSKEQNIYFLEKQSSKNKRIESKCLWNYSVIFWNFFQINILKFKKAIFLSIDHSKKFFCLIFLISTMRSARIIKLSFKIEDRQLWIIYLKSFFVFFQIPLLLKKKNKKYKTNCEIQ